MNPFSAFLQPPTQRSPLAGAGEFVQQQQQLALQKRAQGFREQESALDNTRADSYLKLQQAQQARSFSDKDQEQIQGLLAAYKQAEDQGDQVLMSRALQDLKAFGGVDVAGGTPSGSTPQPPPPLPGMPPLVQVGSSATIAGGGLPKDFTGTFPDQANPIGDAIATELATREKLRARTEAPDLSQEDFEADLIANPQSIPESAPDGPEVTDPADITDPGTVSAGSVEADFDADSPTETASEAPQAAAAFAPGLGGGLPVRISKGGKQLYESTGPSGRWVPMVQSVFQAAAQHQDPEFAAAGKRAQEMATKLIGVDGIAPKDAIKFAASQLENEIQQITKMRGIELSTRPRWGGGGVAGSGLLGKTQDMAESIQIYDDNARAEAAKIQEEDRQYEAIEAAISSGNPSLQRDAVNVLLKVRSGSAVTASEDARISQINGLVAQVQDRLGRWTGGQMTPEMVSTIRQIAALKRQVSAAKIKRIYAHQARLYRAQNQGKVKDPSILEERAKTLQAGGQTSDVNADLYE